MTAPHALRRARPRCATRAQLRGDHMIGTAFPAARLLLVEQPYPWGPEGLRTSHFEASVALALEARARAEGIRVQAIRGLGRPPAGCRRRWALVDTRGATPVTRWGDFGDDAELLDLPLDGTQGEPDHEPFYLVCTHGRHDPCCALHGRPVLTALAAARPGRVWQASHLGGCRFAPTVLVLPLGLMYGRVPASVAPEFAAAADDGEVVGAWLRGRVGTPPVAQAAIGFAHEHLGLARCRDVSLTATRSLDADTARVTLDTSRGACEVTVTRERVDASGLTCGQPGPSWFVAHRALGLTLLD